MLCFLVRMFIAFGFVMGFGQDIDYRTQKGTIWEGTSTRELAPTLVVQQQRLVC